MAATEIEPSETEIVGSWIAQGDKVVGDQNCERIERPVSSHLLRLTADASGWDSLYLYPSDGTYWECVYPQSHMHGGGPPQLRRLTIDEATLKYGDWSSSEKSK